MTNKHLHGGRVFSLARELGVRPEEILDFSASINPLGPAPGVRAAVADAFDRIGHYPEIGSPSLCTALAAHHGLPAVQITVANGSTELIHMVPRLAGNRGKRALLIAPTFSEYAHALESAQWEIDHFHLTPEFGFALDQEKLAAALANSYDLLYLCNPGNPTGRLYPVEETLAVYELCHRAGCFLVVDEAFMDFAEEQSLKHLLPETEDWLILRSMTKFCGFPGLRVGYSFSTAPIAARLQRLLPPWNIGVLAESAALAALADHEHNHQTLAYVARERQNLSNQLKTIQGLQVFPSAANYLLVMITSGTTASRLEVRLRDERILIRNCANFTGLDDRFFRIAVRRKEENARLLAELQHALN